MAAAGIYALNHHLQRLSEDHRRAKELGKIVSDLSIVNDVYPIETNIVIFTIDSAYLADNIVKQWMNIGLKASPFGKHQIRLVTHLDFTDDDLAATKQLLKDWNP